MQSSKAVTRSVATTVSAIALTMLMAAPALAAEVIFSGITGIWQNVTPNNVFGLEGEGTPQIFWGQPISAAGKSGYIFAPSSNQTVNVPPDAEVDLGTFTHENQPISLTPPSGAFSITGAQLAVSMNISVDGADQGNFTFLFDFTHEETPNGANPCAYGGANEQGVNVNGCADRVTETTAGGSDSFVINGVTYTIDILGFKNGDPTTNLEFLTIEEETNIRTLVAVVTQQDPPNGIPEPASLAVLGSALAALGGISLFRRRRTRNAA